MPNYESVFSWRYGSGEMRELFSEENRRLNWRKAWVALARAENKAGLVSDAELRDIEAHAKDVDLKKSLELEKEIKHDVVAELRVFSEQCKIGGGKIHLGATSMDVIDNADVLIQKQALDLLESRLAVLLKSFEKQIRANAGKPCMAFTHLQPAEPTTVGYRLSVYGQDLLNDFNLLRGFELKGKGLKGAVGTGASFARLLEGKKITPQELEKTFLQELHLSAFEVSMQTYPRKQDYRLLTGLASLAQSMHKFAFDLRLLQMLGEASEPFKEKQVGSSAMPFKRNPRASELVCSLTRLVSAMPQVAWDNAAFSGLERTLDDSANRRVAVPEAFLALEECLLQLNNVVSGIKFNDAAIERNLDKFGVFSCTEAVLMKAVEKGGDRQQLHEVLRELSMKAWAEVEQGKKNPLVELLIAEKKIGLSAAEIEALMNVAQHVGFAEEKALAFAGELSKVKAGAQKEYTGF